MKVKEFMIQDVIVAHPNDSIKNVMKKLVQHKIGGVPVVTEEGFLLGMISDGDILRKLQPKGSSVYFEYSYIAYDYHKESLEEVLSYAKNFTAVKAMKRKAIVKVKENDDLDDVVKLLSKHHFKKISVVNEKNQVVGVISRGDVIRSIQENLLTEM